MKIYDTPGISLLYLLAHLLSIFVFLSFSSSLSSSSPSSMYHLFLPFPPSVSSYFFPTSHAFISDTLAHRFECGNTRQSIHQQCPLHLHPPSLSSTSSTLWGVVLNGNEEGVEVDTVIVDTSSGEMKDELKVFRFLSGAAMYDACSVLDQKNQVSHLPLSLSPSLSSSNPSPGPLLRRGLPILLHLCCVPSSPPPPPSHLHPWRHLHLSPRVGPGEGKVVRPCRIRIGSGLCVYILYRWKYAHSGMRGEGERGGERRREREEGRGWGVTGEGRREGCSPLLASDWKWLMCTCSLPMEVCPLRYVRREGEEEGEGEGGRKWGRRREGTGRREGCSPLLDSDWKWLMCTCSLRMEVCPLRYERRGGEGRWEEEREGRGERERGDGWREKGRLFALAGFGLEVAYVYMFSTDGSMPTQVWEERERGQVRGGERGERGEGEGWGEKGGLFALAEFELEVAYVFIFSTDESLSTQACEEERERESGG